MAADPLPKSPGLTPRLLWLARNLETIAREEYWRPDAVPYSTAQTFDRTHGESLTNLTAGVLQSGVLSVHGGAVLLPEVPVDSITFVSAQTAAVTPTNQWAVLLDQDRNVLAKSEDLLTEAWDTFTEKTFSLATPYVPSEVEPVYLGLVVVAATPPTLRGISIASGQTPATLPPILSGVSTGGLTNPASLGPTADPLTIAAGQAYAYVGVA